MPLALGPERAEVLGTCREVSPSTRRGCWAATKEEANKARTAEGSGRGKGGDG